MVKFKVYEARTFYKGPDEELERMYEVLRIKDKNAHFRAQFILRRMGYFNRPKESYNSDDQKKFEQIQESTKWIKFYDSRRKSFGTGLLSEVCSHLKNLGISYERDDHRSKPISFGDSDVRFEFQDKIEEREEQEDAFRTALQRGTGILHLATNAGKTEIAAMIISAWALKKERLPRTLFLIHRKGLARQTADRFERHLGVKCACLGGSSKRKLHRITVSTTQTAANLVDNHSSNFLEFLSKCDLVFVDELANNKAKSIVKVLNECRARMRFGLSGTIDKKNSSRMMHYIGLIGPIISEIRNRELVEKGRSAKPYMRMVKVEDDEITGSFGNAYDYGIVKNRKRNKLIVKEALRYVDKGYRTLITVGRIEHGRIIEAMLEKKVDFPIEFVRGSTSIHSRDKVTKKFEKGKTPILIASPIFDIGVDLPKIEALVIAGAGKSWELTLQRLGRSLRKKEGKNKVYVSDFLDFHNQYLMSHSAKRLEYYIAENIASIKVI